MGVGVGGCIYVCFKVKAFLDFHRVHPQCTICASRSFNLCFVHILSPPPLSLSFLLDTRRTTLTDTTEADK